MGRKAREEAALRALARKVWGDSYYDRRARPRAGRRDRLTAVAGIGVGIPMLVSALAMIAFSTAASAHTSTIKITCTHVEFVYQNFEAVTATSHESVTIDGVEVAQKDFTFPGPSASDTITISVPSGTHSVHASDHWSYNGRPRGQAYASQTLSNCGSTTTTTKRTTTTTTCPKPTTTSTRASTTTTSTVLVTSTTTVPATTSTTTAPTTTVPETSTSTTPSTEPTTTTSTSTSTSVPESSTTSTPTTAATTTTLGESTTSTTFHEQGSTSTSTPLHEQGSTSTPPTTPAPGNLPFTGSGGPPLGAALAALGVGLLAVGLASLRKVVDQR